MKQTTVTLPPILVSNLAAIQELYPSLKNPYFIEEVEETKVLLYELNREEVSV